MPTDCQPLVKLDEPNPCSQRLPDEVFAQVVENAPLIAIDLLVEDQDRRVLLGCRSNPPAKGTWFVPGGRLWKNETLAGAFERITRDELGQAFGLEQSIFVGVYQHFYPDNFLGEHRGGTHYIALAHRLWCGTRHLPLPRLQHAQYRWSLPSSIARDPLAHAYTRAYFIHDEVPHLS